MIYLQNVENTIYSLSEIGPYHDNSRKLEAQLIDATTGAKLCSKEFTPLEDSFSQRPIELAFALMGEGRNLVSCGHADRACKTININDGEVNTFDDALGPGRFCSSFQDTEVDNNWLIVGG